MTAQAHAIQLIALNKLVASPRNVRKQGRKADLDALAASIAAHGLLQISVSFRPTMTNSRWMPAAAVSPH